MCAQPNGNVDLLSSWKEIADYLKCDKRTCLRWEKSLKLPIHRFEGAQRSRIFAYKHELDDWLSAKLKNGQGEPLEPRRRKRGRALVYAALPMIVAGLIAAFFLTRPNAREPLKKPNAYGVPVSTGPFTMRDGDLVSTEYSPEGRLRVWRKGRDRAYTEVWKIEPVRHSSLAVGNLAGAGDCEVVAPGICREDQNVGDRVVSRWRFFLNIYKPGVKDWWKTTFNDKENCLYEDDYTDVTETAVGNVDATPGNEVVLMTAHSLGVFRFDAEAGEFKLLRSRNTFMDNAPLFLKALALADIDGDGTEEILVGADEWKDRRTPFNKAWVLILKVRDGWPEIARSIPVVGNHHFHSLRVGDVVPGGEQEIVFPLYRRTNDAWNTYVVGLNADGITMFERPLYDKGVDELRTVHLDVGDVAPMPGDEIVVATHFPKDITLYSWNAANLVEGPRATLDFFVGPVNVSIDRSLRKKDELAKIMVSGNSDVEGKPGRFYLELFAFDNGFLKLWQRTPGDPTDLSVAFAAFGKSRD